MNKLPSPPFLLSEVLESCIKSSNSPNKIRLRSLVDSINQKSTEYETKLLSHQLYDLKSILSNDDKKFMKNLYKTKFVSDRVGDYYNTLLALTPHGICPYCQAGQVSTIDHYIAKSVIPDLSVTPTNLLPACRDCNTNKLDVSFTCSEEEHLHPYFDVIDDVDFLICTIDYNTKNNIFFIYSIKNLTDTVLYTRINNHFKYFKLFEKYSILANQFFFNDIAADFVDHLNRQHICYIKDEIQNKYLRWNQNNKNSYKTVLLKVLSESKNDAWIELLIDFNQQRYSKLPPTHQP